MKKTIFLHIGAHKTASTFLQALMCENRQYLLEQGIFYPRYPWIEKHVNFNRTMVNGSVLYSEFQHFLAESLDTFRTSNCRMMLLSEENLFIGHHHDLLEWIERYRSEFKIIVFCYIRQVISYAVSMWSFLTGEDWINFKLPLMKFLQIVKQSFENKKSNHYADLVNYPGGINLLFQLKAILPENQVIVRPFDKNCFKNQTIEDDFFEVIDCDARYFKKIAHTNISPNLKQAEALLFVNQSISNVSIRKQLRNYIFSKNYPKDTSIAFQELDLIDQIFSNYEKQLIDEFWIGTSYEKAFDGSYEKWKQKIEQTTATRFLSETEKKDLSKKIYKVLFLKGMWVVVAVQRFGKLCRLLYGH